MSFFERLNQYLLDVKQVHKEASKTYYFLKFVSDVFSSAEIKYSYELFPYLEKYLKTRKGTLGIKGRVDALLGNIIIEFKDELTESKIDSSKEQLKKYISIIWMNEKEKPKYLLVATDGVRIIVYRPNFVQMKLFEDQEGTQITSDRIVLESLDEISLDKVDPDYAYVWLDRYILYRELQFPTTENFLSVFGKGKPVFKQSIGILNDKWTAIKDDPHIKVLYEEWEKYLEIVYGKRIGGEDLFLRHTYLATLSKLMATIFYSGGALPSPDEILKTLNGRAFKEWGIENFLEYDFFSWILRAGKEFAIDFSRHLIYHLRSFDLEKLTEDVLKGLYQELVDPEERHALGEYYTPDWLAIYMVDELIKNVDGSVLDPACGSGTFLMNTIKKKIETFEKKGLIKNAILENVLSQVYGIDIHPLAIITSKVNYLLALGDLVRHKQKPIVIPVFLADSIKLPRYNKLLEGVEAYSFKINDDELFVPAKIFKSSLLSDRFFSLLKVIVESDVSYNEIETIMYNSFDEIDLKDGDYDLINNLVKKLKHFREVGKDTIWTYILKNIYTPILLSERKFDYLIGNPPWIAYRYFESVSYQDFLKEQIINQYNLLYSNKIELITHMEFATLFFTRTTDLYLKDHGKIGFVMPRGVFSSDQHDNFRKCEYKPDIGIIKIYDLDKVDPLFKNTSCVIFGVKGENTKYPIDGIEFIGKLDRKNASAKEANNSLQRNIKKYYLNVIGDRSFLFDRKIEISRGRSHYKKLFSQGATIVPRNFWFVDIHSHPVFGINPNKPYVKTSEKIIKFAKPPYKYVILEGNIEKEYLFATLRGSEIIPFGHLPFLVTVLPVKKNKDKFIMINLDKISKYMHDGIKNWIINAEQKWNDLKSEKIKENCIEWLNYRNKIEIQNPEYRFKVLYITSGTYLASCYINLNEEDIIININNTEISLNSYVADTKTYYFETEDEEEAIYLTSLLNSQIVDNLIKGMQSRGDFGPRDIHKKVLELPIPKYNPNNSYHYEIYEIGKKCKKKVVKILPSLAEKYTSIGHIRKKVKAELKDELDKISEIVIQIFSEQTKKGKLNHFISESKSYETSELKFSLTPVKSKGIGE